MDDPHAGARLWSALHEAVARAVVGAEQPLRLLARYGAVRLTKPEHRRALGRWRRIRDGLRPVH